MTAAALLPRSLPTGSTLQRSLLLALLLHLWLVLLFGNVSGGAAPGEGVWGRLTVRLAGPVGAPAPSDARTPLNADQPSAVPAATGGRPARAAATQPTDTAPPSPPPVQRLPDGFRPLDAAAALPPPPALSQAPAAVLPDATLPPPVQRLEGPATAREAARLPATSGLQAPAPQAALPADLAQPLPAPSQRLDARPDTRPDAGLGDLPQPALLRPAATPSLGDLPATDMPAAVQRLEAPAVAQPLQRLLPGQSAPRLPAAARVQDLAPAPELPAPVQRLDAEATAPSPSPTPVRVQAPAPSTATTAALQSVSAALPGRVGAPSATDATGPTAAAGPGVGSEPGPAASAPAPALRPLNLTLPRGDLAARRGPGVLELLPQPPERKSKLEKALDGASPEDCRKAYADKGLLAVVPLAVDAVRGKGCQW